MGRILGMTRENLLNLDPNNINWFLSKEEIVYIATTLGAYWQYNYASAMMGRVGLHAELKSLRHSDGFFTSRVLLQSPNIREIMAKQLAFRFHELNAVPRPAWVAGIPDGATELGQDVAKLLGAKNAEARKEDGRIVFPRSFGPGETLLLVEDFCSSGTAFIGAAEDAVLQSCNVKVLPFELVLINRRGLEEIIVGGRYRFKIIPVVNHWVRDWSPSACPLCKMGSLPIKPKETDENWRLITTAQSAKIN